jgi:hypothetical protein
MAHFSDRLFSANKLIIAGAVVYAAGVTFAHAANPQLDFMRCTYAAQHEGPVAYINTFGDAVHSAPNFRANLEECRRQLREATGK